MIDPNFLKLFKMSQLTIEYLLVRFKIFFKSNRSKNSFFK
jgi:hypothetical protein